MAVDLKSMSRKELEALRARIDKQLEKLGNADRKKALEAAEAAAKQHGFSLAQLTGEAPAKRGRPKKTAAPKGGKKASAAAKYRNPADPNATWTGRGRRPAWVNEGLAAGKSLEDFAIK